MEHITGAIMEHITGTVMEHIASTVVAVHSCAQVFSAWKVGQGMRHITLIALQ